MKIDLKFDRYIDFRYLDIGDVFIHPDYPNATFMKFFGQLYDVKFNSIELNGNLLVRFNDVEKVEEVHCKLVRDE